MTHTVFDSRVLPNFTAINYDTAVKELQALLDDCRKKRQALLQQTNLTWDSLFLTLDELDVAIHQFWSPIAHLHAVAENDALRNVYNNCLPLLTAYQTEMAQDENLYQAVLKIAKSDDFHELNAAQKKVVENALRDFRLAGVLLDASQKDQFAVLQQELSQLSTKFSEHLLDATGAYYFHTDSEAALAGLPLQSLQLAKEEAARRNLQGYVITLDYPSYSGAMKFLVNRQLREKLYEAYTTRASELGPNEGKWDNGPVMITILAARQKLAHLLGFLQYADYSLATKMAKSTDDVLRFLHDLLNKSLPFAKKEFAELSQYAESVDGLKELNAWDIAYYSEKLQLATFEFNQEDLRPYFPVDKALYGLFKLSEILFGIHIVEDSSIATWHKDARFFTILNEDKECIAGFYIDLYARSHKREGAWMDDCKSRHVLKDNTLSLPVAYLTCNFMRGVDGKPALLTHDDVMTLFHEFGHCLHHLLTKVNYLAVSGIHGVPWDAVEFPSQFMENFCWDKTILKFLSAHVDTKAPLPDALYDKLLRSKHFQSGMQLVRQLEFALFDFTLHMQKEVRAPSDIIACLQMIRKQTAVYAVPSYNRFQNSFAHIFAGGYAAGYYSYLWANVLAADAFETFETKGLLQETLGRAFRDAILAVGGSVDPLDAFKQFQGRAPTVDALLRQNGILSKQEKESQHL